MHIDIPLNSALINLTCCFIQFLFIYVAIVQFLTFRYCQKSTDLWLL